MAASVSRGDIWMLRFAPPDKRRPVVVLSRQSLIDVLHTVMVTAITSTRRGSPTEVDLGVEDGLKGPCTANLAHVHTVAQRDLRSYVSTLSATKMREVCRALAIATGCDASV